MDEISKPIVVVRISEFASSKAVDIELPPGCTVLQLKELVAKQHERQPLPQHQRFVLLGKPLNDDKAVVVDLIQAKGIDPATVTTIHLVVSDPATRHQAGSRASSPATTSQNTTTPAPASTCASPSDPSSNVSTSAQPASPAPPVGATQDTPGQQNAGPSSCRTPDSAAGTGQTSSRVQPRPVMHRPMMHPILAAAYNAALVELAESNCEQQRTFATVTSTTGRQQSIPFALSTPLHLSDPSPHGSSPTHGPHASQGTPGAPAGQTIIINTNNVHLTGTNADSLASLISRANVRLRMMPNGQRMPAGAAGAAGAAAAAAAAAAQGGGQGAMAHAADAHGRGAPGDAPPAFLRQPGAGWRLQLQFQLNLMQILRFAMSILFMRTVLQMSTLRIVLLLTGYFVGRAVVGMRLQRAFSQWLDGVIAYTRQPLGPPRQPAPPPPGAPPAQEGPAAAAAAAAAAQGPPAAGAAAAAAAAPAAPQEPQVQPQPGILLQIWVGVLSFFLSMLPQFNADGADAAAIAAAQEDLDNAQINGGGGGGGIGNQAAVF